MPVKDALPFGRYHAAMLEKKTVSSYPNDCFMDLRHVLRETNSMTHRCFCFSIALQLHYLYLSRKAVKIKQFSKDATKHEGGGASAVC